MNKLQCTHRCCKGASDIPWEKREREHTHMHYTGTQASEEPALEELKMGGDGAVEREDYKTAVQLYGRAVCLYADQKSYDSFERACAEVVYSDEEKRVLQDRIDGDDAETTFLVANLLYLGKGGFSEDWEAAFQVFSRTASLGHVYALYLCALCLEWGHGVERDEAAARRMYIQAANKGCGRACFETADIFCEGVGGPQDFYLAALYYQRAISLNYNPSDMKDCLDDLKRVFPMDVAPWSRWAAEPEVHSLVPPGVHAAMRTWSLVAKRSPLPRDLHRIISRYISTRIGW